jgi:hypothetical protein
MIARPSLPEARMPSSARTLVPAVVFVVFCLVGGLAGWAMAGRVQGASWLTRIWLELSAAWQSAVPWIYGGCVLVVAAVAALVSRWLVR